MMCVRALCLSGFALLLASCLPTALAQAVVHPAPNTADENLLAIRTFGGLLNGIAPIAAATSSVLAGIANLGFAANNPFYYGNPWYNRPDWFYGPYAPGFGYGYQGYPYPPYAVARNLGL